LEHLDEGMMLHYDGEYERSNSELSLAEREIYDNFAKSVSQAALSAVTNDTVIDYAGETYEDIYTNIFMALNYLHLQNTENAFVEIRRFDNKLREVSLKYEDVLSEARQSGNTGDKMPDYNLEFHNSALARYLSLIMYRSAGDLGNAEVDLKLLQSAFGAQQNIYPFPIPSSVAEEIAVPVGSARLNVLSFAGKAPAKEEVAIREFLVNTYYKLALPVMVKVNSQVASIECTVKSGGAEIASRKLELLESIENIALDTFKQHQALIYVKGILRSLARTAATSVAGAVADTSDNETVSLIARIFQFASIVGTEIVEQADVRTSRFFPGKAFVTGFTLESGVYDIEVVYKAANGRVVDEERFTGIPVKMGQVNLLESICLK
jgi:hypothetical protein